ncbi:hypothetical protein LOK55_00465 [Microbacterium sp. F2E]|uniref:hypothetical protein n=1 Tax=Microbacterium sp. F2E TaxID=2895284 RepID=UPI001E5F47BA|nr:hypothetical protein [Microbacterium sp. F2E]MCC9052802.1 hypothetical protein [Microbacterium sp. F2E]
MSAISSDVTDVLLEVFTWVGFGGSAVLAVVMAILWAADGTWLPAEAIVDTERGPTGEVTVVRWFDADGDANSAVAGPAEASALAGREQADIWYRHGWTSRMRLQRRPPGLRAVTLAAAGLFALGVLCLVSGWVVFFLRG